MAKVKLEYHEKEVLIGDVVEVNAAVGLPFPTVHLISLDNGYRSIVTWFEEVQE